MRKKKELEVPKPIKKYPRWFKFKEVADYRKLRVAELYKQFCEPIKVAKKFLNSTDNERLEYLKELENLSAKQLFQIGRYELTKPKYSLLDRWHKIERKSCIGVRIYHKNGSCSHFITAKNTRLLHMKRGVYLFPPNAGVRDNNYKLIFYSFFEDCVFPIVYKDDVSSAGLYPDPGLLKKSIKFEYAERLASSGMSKRIDIAMMFSILAFAAAIITLFVCVKGFGMI